MGLLDDAIREHLDLKRRRGADPTEIAREEAEALGPVRRDALDESDDLHAGSYADHEPAALDEPAAAYDDEERGSVALDDEERGSVALDDEERGSVALDDEERGSVALDRDAEPAPYEHERPVPSEPPTTHDAPYAEPEEESATPPHGDPLAHQQTREFSATELGDALGDESSGGSVSLPPVDEDADADAAVQADPDVVPADDASDDELEETPDFLQETPEHDRLWFEQKPPKDFDF